MRTELEVNPLQLLVDIYPQAVKKNDSVIRLGNVEFNSLFANRIMTNEVQAFIYVCFNRIMTYHLIRLKLRKIIRD